MDSNNCVLQSNYYTIKIEINEHQTKNHSIIIEEHKSVTKTLTRIKNGYSWLHMKLDII
jgi:hypothetical protein